MSAKFFSWAFKQDCPSPAAKLVLLKLADHSDVRGYSWPSVGRITRETGLSERTVRKCLRLLEQVSLIQIERRVQGKRQTTNGYYLAIGSVDKPAPPPNTEQPHLQGSAAAGAGSSGTSCTPNITPTEPPENLPLAHQDGSDAPPLKALIIALRSKLGGASFDAWFEEAEFHEGPPVEITVPRRFKANWIRGHFSGVIESVFGEALILAADERRKK